MTSFLCPGQGAQHPDFLHNLPQSDATQQTLAEASAALDCDVLSLDNDVALKSTIAVQLTAVIAGVAMARTLNANGISPDAVAGLSVGSFTAAVIAGAIDFSDSLRLVKLRATQMENAYPSGYGMAAFGGFNQLRLERLAAAQATVSEPLYLANFNAPTEIVVTGAITALERLIDAAKQAGARRASLLNVSVPSHCPLLDSVSQDLRQAIAQITVHAPKITYVGNRRARVLRDANAVIEELTTNVCNPVLWHDSTTLLYELGERFFLEMPPGGVLTGLATDAFADAMARATETTPLETLTYIARRYAETDR